MIYTSTNLYNILAPKLRHSFVGLSVDPLKNARRPNSLISDCSVSSGTSTASLSKSSTTSSASATSNAQNNNNNNNNISNNNNNNNYNNNNAPLMAPLELINEMQTLSLGGNNTFEKTKYQTQQHNKTLKKAYKNNHNHSSVSSPTCNSLSQSLSLTSTPISSMPSTMTCVRIRNKGSHRNGTNEEIAGCNGDSSHHHNHRNGNKRSTTIVSQLSMGNHFF